MDEKSKSGLLCTVCMTYLHYQGSSWHKLKASYSILHTWVFVSHPQGISINSDTSTPTFAVGRVDPEEKHLTRGQAPGHQFWTASSDVDEELEVSEDLHVELLAEAGAEALLAVHLEAVMSLVGQCAISGGIRRACK